MNPRLMICAALGVLALAGCASVPRAADPAAASVLRCDADGDSSVDCVSRTAALQATLALQTERDHTWTLQGRAVIKTADRGGNVRVEWQQHGAEAYTVTLSAPVTRQSWRLEVRDGLATVHGLPDGPVSGPDAPKLLLHATGWQLPLDQLRDWLRGKPAPQPFVDTYLYDAATDGRLVGLRQAGWEIHFTPQPGTQLPKRIDATMDGGTASVRLIIDAWDR